MSLTSKVASGAILLAIARVAGQVFGLASTIVVARFLTPDDYGVFAAAMALLFMVSVLAEFPVSQAIIHLRDIRDEDYDTAFTISIFRSLLIALVLVILSGPLSSFIKDARVAPVISALGVYVILLGLRNPRLDSFAREMDFSREAIIEISAKFGAFVVAVVFALLLRSYWALVIGISSTALIQITLSYVVAPKLPRLTLASFKRLFGYSVWVAGQTILGQIYQLIDTITLGRFKGAETLGLYSMGSLLASRSGDIASAPLLRSSFAAFAHIQGEAERVREAFLNAIGFMAVLILPIMITLYILCEPVIALLLGTEWLKAAMVVRMMAIVFLSLIIYTPMMALFFGLGRTRLLFLRNLFFTAVYGPVAVWTILHHGLPGLLVVKASMIMGLMVCDMFLIRHAIGLGLLRQLARFVRPVLSGAVMCAVYYAARPYLPVSDNVFEVGPPLAVAGALGAAAYASTLTALWFLAGRPEGVETRLLGIAGKILVMIGRLKGRAIGQAG